MQKSKKITVIDVNTQLEGIEIQYSDRWFYLNNEDINSNNKNH